MTRPKIILERIEGSSVLGAKDSVTVDLTDNKVLLVNDQASPGNLQMYGTNDSGNKGWISKVDLSLDNVDNTSDVDKPVSAATQTALNGKLSLTGGTMSGAIAMGSNKITGVTAGSSTGEAVSYDQLSTEITNRTNADTTLQNNINTEASTRASADTTLQNNINSEATTRASADTTLTNSKVAKAGDTMSGALDMGSNKITGLANGTASNDAVNKSQLDAAVALVDESTIAWTSFASASISLSAGWSANSPAPEVRKYRGIVYMRGFVRKSTTPNSADTIATVPVAYRPISSYTFVTTSKNMAGGYLMLQIDTSGNVVVREAGKTDGTAMTDTGVSFDNIQFDIAH